MKYTVNFVDDFRHFKEIDEIILRYDKVAPNLPIKIQEWADKRIVVDIRTCPEEDVIESFSIFKEAVEVHPDIAFLLRYEHHSMLEDECKLQGYNFFYDMHINTKDKLLWVVQQGVSDIYLTDELAFSFRDLFVIYNKINFRMFPNVAQSTFKHFDTINRFFIRPEDISLYEKYENVIIEFFGPLDRQSVLYEIYTSQKWVGSLNEVIMGLKENINNMSIVPIFGVMRMNCNKHCETCTICERVEYFATELKDAELGFRKDIDDR